MVISDLRNAARFAATIANRGWHEWWTDTEMPLSEYQSGIEQMAAGSGIPMAFVAHDGERYVGSVLLIGSDLDIRPQYSPWIAALWVEPEFRRRGVAEELIHAARSEAERQGHHACYLCAAESNSPYYRARGFRLVESAVDGLDVFII